MVVGPINVDLDSTLPRGLRARQAHIGPLHGNREISEVPRRRWWVAGNLGKAVSRNPMD
jgi:hypothetical protein